MASREAICVARGPADSMMSSRYVGGITRVRRRAPSRATDPVLCEFSSVADSETPEHRHIGNVMLQQILSGG
ncbi:hypothetical protein MUK42_23206 [Musa troglodytarum]|uniref:Uncharacterized protein n=1 Tax=Musa troglodytarum TaxID=320322 RepID=A0A9E7HYL2_9LILI|nr:hypothetical protein MUK42_23206 [Musa troglodytarum]